MIAHKWLVGRPGTTDHFKASIHDLNLIGVGQSWPLVRALQRGIYLQIGARPHSSDSNTAFVIFPSRQPQSKVQLVTGEAAPHKQSVDIDVTRMKQP